MDLLIIALGGALGAVARYLLGGWVFERVGGSFPYGTLLINVSGSFVLGFFLTVLSERLVVNPEYRLFFAVGFLGAYTTFSTWTYDSAALLLAGDLAGGLANLFGSLLLGMAAVFAGIAVGRLVGS